MKSIYFILPVTVQQPGSIRGSATKNAASSKPVYTYQAHILPLLKSNCNPCHFPGGKVYDEYPFDNHETVATPRLKLNTRLKEKEKDVVSQWVQSGKVENSSTPQ